MLHWFEWCRAYICIKIIAIGLTPHQSICYDFIIHKEIQDKRQLLVFEIFLQLCLSFVRTVTFIGISLILLVLQKETLGQDSAPFIIFSTHTILTTTCTGIWPGVTASAKRQGRDYTFCFVWTHTRLPPDGFKPMSRHTWRHASDTCHRLINATGI